MSRVVVTGGAGFIGSWITEELINRGHTVLVMDDCSGGRRGNLGMHERLYFCHIDLRATPSVMFEIQDFKPDVIYHLAANAREGASFFQPISVTGRNTGAYVNVLTAGIKAGVKRIIVFSSIAVYGDQEPPFTEDMPKKPVDVYGLAKAQMEDMTQMMAECHGFEYTIFRPHNVFGPKQAIDDIYRNVFGIWMNQIMRDEPMTIYGDGSQMRAFSYIEDSLPCYIKGMYSEPNQIFNIGSDTPVEIKTAATMVRVMMGAANHPVKHLKDRHGEVRFAFSDHTKAKRELLFDEKIGFGNGLGRMARWARGVGPRQWRNYDEIEISDSDKIPELWK